MDKNILKRIIADNQSEVPKHKVGNIQPVPGWVSYN